MLPSSKRQDNAAALALRILRDTKAPIFAIIDGAAECGTVEELYTYCNASLSSKDSPPRFRSLLSGKNERSIGQFGPIIIEFDHHLGLLESIISKGWGHAWGFAFSSNKKFEKLRSHFANFLTAKLPDNREVYFRFYDPNILDTLLTAPNQTTSDLTRPTKRLISESTGGEHLIEIKKSRRIHHYPIAKQDDDPRQETTP